MYWGRTLPNPPQPLLRVQCRENETCYLFIYRGSHNKPTAQIVTVRCVLFHLQHHLLIVLVNRKYRWNYLLFNVLFKAHSIILYLIQILDLNHILGSVRSLTIRPKTSSAYGCNVNTSFDRGSSSFGLIPTRSGPKYPESARRSNDVPKNPARQVGTRQTRSSAKNRLVHYDVPPTVTIHNDIGKCGLTTHGSQSYTDRL